MANILKKVFGSLTGLLCFMCACSGNSARVGSNAANSPAYQNINAEAAYQKMQKSGGFVLLDVRTDAEFLDRHIEGAILIPDFELDKRAAAELPDKDAVILVYCRSGARSAGAAKVLAGKGYTQVFNFGGIINWPYETVSGR